MPDARPPRPPFDRRLAVLLAGCTVGPVVALTAWGLATTDRLPDPVAHHWGLGGRADGFSSLWLTLVMVAGTTMIIAVPMAIAALRIREPLSRRPG